MSISRYIFGGITVGLISVTYNYLIFSIFDFYPDISSAVDFINFNSLGFYILVFFKNFLVGVILIVLFSTAYMSIINDKGDSIAKGIFFFVLYAVFALLAFSVGDMLLMESEERLLILLTADGFVETLIATIPIRLFQKV